MIDNKIFSKDWVYQNIYGLSPDEYEDQKEAMLDEAMKSFRLSQLENEGNDPVESGVSYGTPHDLAALYGNKRDKAVGPAQVPSGYDEKEPGRPIEDPTKYGDWKSNFGRDPLGKKAAKTQPSSPGNPSSKLPTLEAQGLKKSLQKIRNKKEVLKEENENGLLSEKNIKPQE